MEGKEEKADNGAAEVRDLFGDEEGGGEGW